MKRALIVGINDYPDCPLGGCVNDAEAVAQVLATDGDGSPNFAVRLLTSETQIVTTAVLHDALVELFSGDADTVLFFFAGHGIINPVTNVGFILSQDGRRPAWGISLTDILTLANKAYPKIKSSIIVLDSCQSGFAGEIAGLGTDLLSVIGNGVTILTSCHRDGTAQEVAGHGVFTAMFVDGLIGSAADICGRITPAAVYSHIDQTLGAWEQRPIYKANVQTFVTLREISPKVPKEVLRQLPAYFPKAAHVFALDPSFEPDRTNVPERFRHIPVNQENSRVFRELQKCNRHGLIVPVDAEHMYDAAMNSTGCKLTALGAHYRNLAQLGRV